MTIRPTKRVVVFILLFLFTLVLLGVTVYKIAHKQDEQDVNYLLLKKNYSNNNLGQSVILYPWEPTSPIKILPFNYEVPAAPDNNLSIKICPGEFESASFVITARKEITGISISVPKLYSAEGNSIPSDAINVRTVKVWYQAGDDISYTSPGFYLDPELLLKDDSLVNVDYVNKTNYLKVKINGSQQYIDISNPNATFPPHAEVQDAQSLQPFSLKENENKQIWLTVQVPKNTTAGDYTGGITISTPSSTSITMNITIKVLPCELEPSPIEYALFYRGILPASPRDESAIGVNSQFKTTEQYVTDLRNMKDHGVLYPTIEQWYYEPSLNLALSLRNKTGLPDDHIYVLSLQTGNSTNVKVLSDLQKEIIQWKNITSKFGYQDVYIYGMDEAKGDVLRSEKTAWQTVHSTGAKVFVAVDKNAVNIAGDSLDLAIVEASLNSTQAEEWHSHGKKIFSYANPQVGVENPDIYRKNYGFALWNAGYDGEMDFAYQQAFGPSIWNDFDTPPNNFFTLRDHVFAYPTSDGVIDTVQWEGFREGVDDTRYVATLIKIEGTNTTAKKIVSDSLAHGEDPAQIREKIIDQILLDLQNAPGSSVPPT